jgi:hypothetical protein
MSYELRIKAKFKFKSGIIRGGFNSLLIASANQKKLKQQLQYWPVKWLKSLLKIITDI